MGNTEIILITGANTGLGFEAIRAFCASSKTYTILLGSRSVAKAEEAIHKAQAEFPGTRSTLTPIQVDVEDDTSIAKAFDHVSSKYGHVDALINNAGAQFDNQLQTGALSMRECWNQSWDVNVTGTQILTHNFVPLLLKASNPRLLFVTSGTSTLAETEDMSNFLSKAPEKGWPKTGGFAMPAYRSAKTGMNMMMREWERVLRNDGVKVWCISPGYLATGLGGSVEANKKRGAGDPALGGQFIKDVVEGKRDGDVGKAIRRDGEIQPW